MESTVKSVFLLGMFAGLFQAESCLTLHQTGGVHNQH